MELTKVHKSEQPLLKRSEAVYRVAFDGPTPSRLDMVKSLHAKEKGTIVVTHVHTIQGQQAALVHCHVYTDGAVSTAVERANLLAKQQPKVEAVAEQA